MTDKVYIQLHEISNDSTISIICLHILSRETKKIQKINHRIIFSFATIVENILKTLFSSYRTTTKIRLCKAVNIMAVFYKCKYIIVNYLETKSFFTCFWSVFHCINSFLNG